MCGIFAAFGNSVVRSTCITNSLKQEHRGPDDFFCTTVNNGFFCFGRLNVMDMSDNGRQPFFYKNYVSMVNGEIYNHKILENRYGISTKSASDCEMIPELFSKVKESMAKLLDGMFALVICDNTTGEVFIARDHIGIEPLYWGCDMNGNFFVSSEMKCLVDLCTTIEIFPPRTYYYGPPKMGSVVTWYNMKWSPLPYQPSLEAGILDSVYNALYNAVKKMLPCDAPSGFLLSGGVDSSLIAGLARKILGPKHEFHTFTIGLENAPDFVHAREVAKHIGSVHHEFVYTVQEGMDLIPHVLKMVETFNVTTIRSSTPQYILAKKIKSLGFKMVMSGEGADEAWAGYLFFHYAPSPEDLQDEMVDCLSQLHYTDCLRTNKSMLACGVETRVPFLDPALLDACMSVPPLMKQPNYISYNGKPIEKGLLRKACDRDNILPASVLWRQKEQFSDGVGYTWIDSIKNH